MPAGAIETFFDEQNQPLFKRVDLGKYLGIKNIRDNFKEFHGIMPAAGLK